ncbi:MAG: Xaa-Pro peptidase family protein [Clostridiales bacterium]|nr:Xaa-Pro peptidase family protein [Clostridiales bacterium]
MKPLYSDRMNQFRLEISQRGRKAFLVTKPQNLHYLSGFRGDSTWIYVTDKEKVIFTDSRYTEQARQECPGWDIIQTKTKIIESLKEYLDSSPITELAFDYKNVSVELHQRLALTLGAKVTLIGEEDPCAKLRFTKDEWELARIQDAAAIADEALSLILPMIKPGVSEKALALELDYQIIKLGSEGVAFETVVAAGPQGAMPHARLTDYKLRAGDFVTLDFGAVAQGYHSDITRTFVLGKPDMLQSERYQCVLDAQQKALAAIKPGMMTRQIDAIARDHIKDAGYGDYFGHGLGHSLGLEIHEEPRFSQIAKDITLTPGMVMTVEPGVYIPGWGGLRIEDSVVLTENGMKILTGYPKTLDEMVII